MSKHKDGSGARRWVVKIGSSLITNNGTGLDREAIANWVRQLVSLQQGGIEVVLVSSGAVAEGVKRLGLKKRPREIHLQQAAAAVGQMGLIQTYESCFQQYGVHTAQVLLTHDDLSNRRRYLNARSTLAGLVDMRVVPVINENDTVATAELCFGDNDTLGALVANLLGADTLIILTDQKGLHEADPRTQADAPLIAEAMAEDSRLLAMAGGSGSLGRGGMITKITAARLAARSGARTVIANGREPDVLIRLAQGEAIGTRLLPEKQPMAARKQWLAGHLKAKGELVIDAGAVKVLRESGRSLLPVGVIAVSGQFDRGEMVVCVDESGQEIARGLVNYDSGEAARIKRQSSRQIATVLGYVGDAEMIHRDNLVVTE
ncbi:glutamate 5-kinase [Pseudohongiella sp.]|uniref:PUA domain-containing protein n=1 Tax=marine sediment metagenome TaxID=412755 RepID=A0A0F9W5A5_9ZZZZ|nr:glutamate 5-kinase [Pseudohongiella sp.]HDZ09273.1 glutamate 5-kinase [Pseudohongiella sp.]HEA62137.1 glutamate 5-kinase [Pseudohongiella sp.]